MSSPKSATISLPLLFLTLASLTLSAAADHNCGHADSVPALLELYGFPGGLVPNNVEDFWCKNVTNNLDTLMLTIELKDSCTVTQEVPGIITVVVEFKPEISATISPRELSGIDGVRVTLTGPLVYSLYKRETLDLTVKGVKVFEVLLLGEVIQFYSAEGIASPTSPTFLFPSTPPNCDPPSAAALDYSGSARVAKNNQDAPMWVYKYGRLLPVVVAA